MLSRVSPIYDNSYVGLWLFEVIGREYDALWDIIRELPQQLSPNSATWLLPFWEERYGLDIGDYLTNEVRRERIRTAISSLHSQPFTPWLVEQRAQAITGRMATVYENTGPYTFTVYVSISENNPQIEAQLHNMLRRSKPSHLSYELVNARQFDATFFFAPFVLRRKRLRFGEV